MFYETALFTACPNGRATTNGALRLSVHVAPKLSNDGLLATTNLSDYPVFRHWTAMLASPTGWWPGAAFDLVFADQVSAPVRARIVSPPPTPALWDAIFQDTTKVRGPRHDLVPSGVLAHPDGETQVYDIIRDNVTSLFAANKGAYPTLAQAVSAFEPLAVDGGARAKRQLSREKAFDARSSRAPSATRAQRAPKVDRTRSKDGDLINVGQILRHTMFKCGPELSFLDPQPDYEDGPEPVKPVLDFHQIVGALGAHPVLLRMLGLVIDLDLAASSLPSGITGATSIRVRPTLGRTPPAGSLYSPVHMRTRCAITPAGFSAVATKPTESNIKDGYLVLGDTTRYGATDLDVAHGAHALTRFGTQVAAAAAGDSEALGIEGDGGGDQRVGPPTLRTSGLTISRRDNNDDLTRRLDRQRDIAKVLDDRLLDGSVNPLPSTAATDVGVEELTRGFRIDVWDDRSNKWHSLHRRYGNYRVGAGARAGGSGTITTIPFDDEGWTQSSFAQLDANASPTDPRADIYVGEAIARWNGWSLSVPPPGKPIDAQDHVVEPDTRPRADDPPVHTNTLGAKGLPLLRFGWGYRLRARTVDLCGNSVPFDATIAPTAAAMAGLTAQPGQSATGAYRRYEPVLAPEIAYAASPTRGEAVETMVIRSESPTDANPTTSIRHLLPPRVTQHVAERHEMFDTGPRAGHVLDPATTYRLITGFPLTGPRPPRPALPNEAGQLDQLPGADVLRSYPSRHANQPDRVEVAVGDQQVLVPWLADPMARFCAVRTVGASWPTAAKVNRAFAGTWPSRQSFLMKLVAGATSKLNPSAATGFTAVLAPGDVRFVDIACGLNAADLPLFGIHNWFGVKGIPAPNNQGANPALGDLQFLTPTRRVRLVHAVKVPVTVPKWASTAVALARSAGDTHVQFDGTIDYSAKSTSQLEVLGRWVEWLDLGPDPTTPPQRVVRDELVETIPVTPTQPVSGIVKGPLKISGPLARHHLGDTRRRTIGYRVRATSAFTSFFVEFKDLGNVPANISFPVDQRGLAAGTVVVRSNGVALKEGEDYEIKADRKTISFPRTPAPGGNPPIPGVTVEYVPGSVAVEGAAKTYAAPSTARPPIPVISEVVPLMQWLTTMPGGLSANYLSTMKGQALRVYLERPWYQSGEGERLAVIVEGPNSAKHPDYREVVSDWGTDPVFRAGTLPGARPTSAQISGGFDVPADTAGNPGLTRLPPRTVTLPYGKSTVTVNAVCLPVDYDPGSDRWFTDVVIAAPNAYWPFVRLSLARFQEGALPGLELSNAVRCDFIQIAPDRSVTVSKGTGGDLRITISGKTFLESEATDRVTGGGIIGALGDTHKQGSVMEVAIERRKPGVFSGEVGWEPVEDPLFENFDDNPGIWVLPCKATITNASTGAATWTGIIDAEFNNDQHRAVIREVQYLNSDRDQGQTYVNSPTGNPNDGFQVAGRAARGRRIVYQDIVKLPLLK